MQINTLLTSNRLKAILVVAGFALCLNTHAQDIHFSQFYEDPLELNPALCGAFPGDIYGELNYRTQWSSVAGSGFGYNTMAATFEYHNLFKKWTKGYLSPGLDFFNDKSGDGHVGITQVNLTLASGIFLADKNTLSLGLQTGFSQHSIDMADLTWDNQYINGAYDASASSGEKVGNSFSYIDFAAGLLYSYGAGQTNMTSNDQFKFNVGGAVYHLTQPSMTYYGGTYAGAAGTKLYMRYVGHAEVTYGIQNTNITMIPGIVYYQQGPASEFDIGSRFKYILRQESKYTGFAKGSAFDLGAYYRWRDAFIIMAGLEFANYSMMVSYDVNTSSLTTASSGRGGLEISLRFINPNPFMGGTESGSTDKSRF
jgi:type IX secretion system PorP/SprF family membrane protein